MNRKHKKSTVPLMRGLTAFLVMLLVVSTWSMPAQAARGLVPTGQRLRTLAGPFYIGFASANNFWTLSDAAIYQDTARSEFNILTPENAMKWDAIHPQQNTYSFTQADQHVQFAQQNNMAVHGHTLVWHSQNPPWLTNGSWNSTTLTNVLYNHIDTVMGHYQGDILVWDVVNEAFEDNGNPRNSIWRNIIGPSYIELAFRRADAADLAAKLIYNDYNIETINSKSNAVYNMAVDFKSRGVPIDGIGFQMHLTSGGINYQSFADNMQRFASLGLEIYITEMDVRYPTPISQSNLTAQATVYGNILDRCLAQPACKSLQVWGFTDKYSWVPGTFPNEGDALIFDTNYNAKPAYYALQAELGGGPTTTPTRTPTRTNTPTRTPTRTNTPIGPTFTPTRTPTRTNTPIGSTFTPTRTPTTGTTTLKLQYRAADTNAGDNQIKPHFNIVNLGTTAVPLSELKIRYWFTREGTANQNFWCDYAAIPGSRSNVTGTFVQVNPARTGANFYLEVGFTAAAGWVAAGGQSGEIQARFSKVDWSNYTETGDYSFDPTKTSFADWTRVTLYRNGVLVWGVEP